MRLSNFGSWAYNPTRKLLFHIQKKDPEDSEEEKNVDLLPEATLDNLGIIGEDISGALFSAPKREAIYQQCSRENVRVRFYLLGPIYQKSKQAIHKRRKL